MVTIALALLALRHGPLVVPALRDDVFWAVPVTVDAATRPVEFKLTTSYELSALNAAWARSAGFDAAEGVSHELAVGSWRLGKPPLRSVDAMDSFLGRPVGGWLGLEVLSRVAIGLDRTTSSIVIWPGGRVARAEARRWVTSGAPWPGDPGKPSAWQGKLSRDEQGMPTVTGSVGGKPVRFRVVFWGSCFVLPDKMRVGLAAERVRPGPAGTTLYVASGVQVGPGGPWAFVLSGAAPLDGIEPDEPTVSINGFPSRRIILDFPGGAIYAQRLRGAALAELVFSLNCVPVHLDRGIPRIGPGPEFATPHGRDSPRHDGDEFIGLGGLGQRQAAELIRGGEKCTAAQVKALAAALAQPGPLRLRHRGKVVVIGE